MTKRQSEKRGETVTRLRFALALVLGLALAIGVTTAAADRPEAPVTLQILSVSDWHAQLDPISGVGGAAVLSSYFTADRTANPNTITLTSGDAFGASPPLSGRFDEEPAVRAMNLMGFDADTFGNHNFDRGVAHLQRMIDLAEFPYVSANLKNVDDELNGVSPFTIIERGGVKIGVIGITNPEAPTLVFPGSFGTIVPTDPIPAANKAKAAAKRAGAQVLVAITHLGVSGFVDGQPVGPLIDFANNIGGFDVILGDHTDIQYTGVHNNALVVENRSKGLTYALTTLSIDARNGHVLDEGVQFVTPTESAVTPDPAIVAMLAPYRAALAAQFDGVIGVATGVFPRGGNIERLREVAIGNLITDAMRLRYGTQVALTNGGGIRAPLPSSYLPANHALRRTTPGYAAGPPYDLVIGDAFTVLPFGNAVLTRTVSGAQLLAALELSVSSIPAANGRFLQISGFDLVYDSRNPAGYRVVSATLDGGAAIVPGGTYTVAMPDFMNAGGDGYTMFVDGQSAATRDLLADVLIGQIAAATPVTPVVEGRIRNLAP